MNKQVNWNEGYYVGKEYIEDIETTEVLIKYSIKVPVVFDNFNIDISESLKVRQIGGILNINLHKTISKKLYDTIVDNFNKSIATKDVQAAQIYANACSFIIGYIRPTLPIVLDEMYRRKYLEGHILSRTISLFDIQEVALLSIRGEGAMIVGWPSPIPGFPPSKSLAKEADAIFIRDFIEAMTFYFGYNVDESIRKIITSWENYLIHYKLKIKNKKFKETVDYYVTEGNYPYKEHNLEILRNNFKYIYDLRNAIVHNKLRLSATNSHIAKKAIGTLGYIFQNKFISRSHFDYIFSLVGQFLSIESIYGVNLDSIATIEKNTREMEKVGIDNIIDSKDKLDNCIFGGLAITEEEKNDIGTK